MHARPFLYVLKALFLLLLDIGVVAQVQRWVEGYRTFSQLLTWPLAFFLLHALLVCVVTASLAVRKFRQQWFDRTVARLEPELYELFSEHAYGTDQTERIKPFLLRWSTPVQHALTEFMPSVTAEARERLGELAVRFGMVKRWSRMAKSSQYLRRKSAVIALSNLPLSLSRNWLMCLLDDPEPEINVIAARALVQTGDPELMERIFFMVLDRTPLVRACVTEDLRRHCTMLSQTVLEKAFAAADDKQVETLLDMLTAWHRSIYFESWKTFIASENGGHRAAILALLPYIITANQPSELAIASLDDEDDRVRIAASMLVGHWQLEAAAPQLTRLLIYCRRNVAKAAANALSALGECGKTILDDVVLSTGGEPGRIALEALECIATEI